MRFDSPKGKGNQLLVFDSKQEADAYFEKLAKESRSDPPPEGIREEVPPSHEVSINNERGTTIKQWIGARMEEEGNPKVYVDLTVTGHFKRDHLGSK